MAKFEVGEVVIFVDSDEMHQHLIGEECEILALLDKSHTSWPSNQLYRTSLMHKGAYVGCAEECLRKKKPPEEKIDWVEKLNLVMPNKEKVTV